MRSAISETIRSRPRATMTSIASSPIFFRISSRPLSKSEAEYEPAGRRALVPQLVAAAAPEPRLTAFDRLLNRFIVHPGEREDLAAVRVAHDRRCEFHRTGIPSAARN